ncbi:insulinase family protein [Naumannella sp. ID2617S]|nr:insulinase family protein [Naumannella sp. ID2617S]
MSTTPPAVRPPAVWHYPQPTETVLDNGIRVLVHHLPGQQVVSAVLALDLPLTLEDRAIEGVASICSRVLDEGTATHSGDRFAEVLETGGAAFYASQGFSGLQAMVDVPAGRLDAALRLLAEAVREPELNGEDVERHVALRLAEIDQLRANSAQLAATTFRGVLLDPSSRPQRMGAGEPETVRAITPEAVRAFHRAHYGPARATLILAGDFSEDPLPQAAAALGDWANPDQRSVVHEPVGPAAPTAVLVDRPGAVQADLRLGGFGIDRTDPRWPDLQVGGYVVGGAFLSRLNRVLREERGFTYGVNLQQAPLRSGGTYAVTGSFRTEVVGAALGEARQLMDLSANPVTPAELADAQNFFCGVAPLRYATADGLADQTALLVQQGLGPEWMNDYLTGIRAATCESATAAYAEIVDLSALTLVVVGDAAALGDPIRDAGFDITVR